MAGSIAGEGSDGNTRPAPGVSAGPASKSPASKSPAKKRTRKKWYVVEAKRQHADNPGATVAILSECTTAKMAERTRQQLQSRANKDPYRTALIAVRTAEQIHSYWGPYDPDLGRHPITKGPPR